MRPPTYRRSSPRMRRDKLSSWPSALLNSRPLLESKHEILTEAERALGTMNNKPEEACPDPTDRASLESDRTFELRMRDRERKLLAKINEAFTRIDSGIYGRCEECA